MVNYEWPGETDNCGGGGRIGKRLADGLRDRGHDVRVVTDEEGHYATFAIRRYPAIRHAVEEHSPDVIHGQFALPTSMLLPWIADTFDVPLVVTAMGADVHDPTRYGQIRPLAKRLNRYVFSRAEAVTTPSRDLANRTVEGDFDIDVIPYGIDPTAWDWRQRSRHDTVRILTVCRLVERKNLLTGAEAIDTLRQNGVDVEWRIVGKGPKAAQLDALGHDWLTLRGYVDDIEAEYGWGDLFFLPSKHEAFGIVVLEALASGLPVVTTGTGGQSEIVTSRVGIANAAPDNPETMAGHLHALVDKYGSYQQHTAGYVADNYSRSRMVDEYETTFKEAIATHATPDMVVA